MKPFIFIFLQYIRLMKYFHDPQSGNRYSLLSTKGLTIYNQISRQLQQLLAKGGSKNSEKNIRRHRL